MPEHYEHLNHSSTIPPSTTQPLTLISLTRAWRISGLLRDIPAEDLKTLLLVLSFTDATGKCQPTLQQLAHAMQVSEIKARRV